jgi:nitric-oxide synthase, plant
VREDWWQDGEEADTPTSPTRRLATPAQLRAELAEAAAGPALIALIVDVLDVPGSLLGGRVRSLVGRNPVFLVGTRADLLPRTMVGRGPGAPSGSRPGPRALAAWLADAAARRGLNVAGAAACSSKSGDGVGRAVGALRRERRGRDLVVLGAANVGKSAFVRAFVKETKTMGSPHFDPAAAAVGRRLPMEAALPGTTLGRIPLRAFAAGGGRLVDTPGLHLHHRLVHALAPTEVAALQPRKALRPWFGTDPSLLGTDGAGMGAGTYAWGGLARFDVRGAPPGTRLIFYGPPALRVGACPLTSGPLNDAALDALAGGGDGAPAFGRASVAARGGLRPARTAALRGRAVDVAVSGLPGWLAIRPPAGDTGPDALAGIEIRVWAPVGVEVFLRDPLPAAEEADDPRDVW